MTTVLAAAANLNAQTSTEFTASVGNSPVFATAPAGDSDRLFVASQSSGTTASVRIVDLNTGTLSGTPYLTINNVPIIDQCSECGLLGLAFDPDFANNGYLYAYVSINSPGPGRNHVSEIRRYKANGNPLTSTTAGSSTLILAVDQPFSNHNGGWIGFNPKIDPSDVQYLHIATGDGGSGGDPQNNSQNINNLLGKILRIDPSRQDGVGGYTIPSSNPFSSTAGADEIWSYGLRNPYRSSFDRATGDMWIGDVGQNLIEEINFEPRGTLAGQNYGWKVMEGFSCFSNSQQGGNPPCGDPGLTPPVYDYEHGFGAFEGRSVTGGYTYRGSVEEFQGHYIFGDFASSHLWSLDPDAIDIPASVRNMDNDLSPDVGGIGSISSFAEDAAGELYVIDYGGALFRIVTASREMEWDGDDAGAGVGGNGSSWSDANNWTRDGVADQAFVSDDPVVFQPGSNSTAIDLNGNRTVASVTFRSGYELDNNSLTVLSGNVTVDDGVIASIDSELGARSNDHSLRKLGGGTLLIGGTAGQTVVKRGTLGGSGSIAHLTVEEGGSVAPGESVGTLTVQNSYTQRPGGRLLVEIGATGHDQLNIAGNASLAGNLSIDTQFAPNTGGSPGVVGDTLTIVNFAAASGNFDEVTGRHGGDGLFYDVHVNMNSVTLGAWQALAGDADGDRDVDITDFNFLAASFDGSGANGPHPWTLGNFDGDGDIDITDFNFLAVNFDTDGYGTSAVPEPSSLVVLMGLAGMLVLGARGCA